MVGTTKKLGIFKISTDSANSATTRGAMDKRRLQADSARKTGLDFVLQEVLIVVENGDGGEMNTSWGNFDIGRFWGAISVSGDARTGGKDPMIGEIL